MIPSMAEQITAASAVAMAEAEARRVRRDALSKNLVTKDLRLNEMRRVLRERGPMTAAQVCEAIGVTTRTFYDYVNQIRTQLLVTNRKHATTLYSMRIK
jgi:DNA-binding CsgD family transcriptional regulator